MRCEVCGADAPCYIEVFDPSDGSRRTHWLCDTHQTAVAVSAERTIAMLRGRWDRCMSAIPELDAMHRRAMGESESERKEERGDRMGSSKGIEISVTFVDDGVRTTISGIGRSDMTKEELSAFIDKVNELIDLAALRPMALEKAGKETLRPKKKKAESAVHERPKAFDGHRPKYKAVPILVGKGTGGPVTVSAAGKRTDGAHLCPTDAKADAKADAGRCKGCGRADLCGYMSA